MIPRHINQRVSPVPLLASLNSALAGWLFGSAPHSSIAAPQRPELWHRGISPLLPQITHGCTWSSGSLSWYHSTPPAADASRPPSTAATLKAAAPDRQRYLLARPGND